MPPAPPAYTFTRSSSSSDLEKGKPVPWGPTSASSAAPSSTANARPTRPIPDVREKRLHLVTSPLGLLPDVDNRFSPPKRRRCCCCTRNFVHYSVVSVVLFVICAFLYGTIEYPNSSGMSGVAEDLLGGLECGACRALLVALRELADAGNVEFSNTFVDACIDLKIQQPEVCRGAVAGQTDIMAHDLRSISVWSTAADDWCNVVFGICANKPVVPYNVPLASRTAVARPSSSSGRNPPFQVVHVTDVHIDRNYREGAETDCGRPICCEYDSTNPMGANVTFPAPKFGNHSCDAAPALVDTLLTAIDAANASFSIFTGDVPSDQVWTSSVAQATSDLAVFYQAYPGAVYATGGNHDTSPVNGYVRASTTTNSSQWVYDLYAKNWAQPEASKHSGSYSALVPDTNLRIISINTQLFYRGNIWLYDSNTVQPDPDGLFAWLASELQEAEDAGQRAWIIGHLPPGKPDCLRNPSNYFNQVLQRYAETIAGVFAGHTHADEFEIGYSDNNNKTAATANLMTYIGGGATPNGRNPSFRVYDVDPDTYDIMDIKVYLSNLSSPTFQSGPTWDLYYSTRDLYGPLTSPPLGDVEPLGPVFYHRLTERFAVDQEAFNLFYERLNGGWYKVANTTCVTTCRTEWMCYLRAMRSEDDCQTVKPGISFGKRSEIPFSPLELDAHDEEEPLHACEGVGALSVLSELGRRARRRGPEPLQDFHRMIDAGSRRARMART